MLWSMRRVAALSLVPLLLLLAAPGAGQVTRVEDIEVEVAGPSPVEAREKALRDAQHTAFRLARGRSGTDADIARAIEGVEIQRERTTSGGWAGRVTVLVRGSDGPVSAPYPGGWLYLLPIERRDGRLDRLWRHDTAWAATWRAVGPIAGRAATAPRGDEADHAAVSAARLADGDAGALAGLARRHRAVPVAVILDRAPGVGRGSGAPRAVEALMFAPPGRPLMARRDLPDGADEVAAREIAIRLLTAVLAPDPVAEPAVSVRDGRVTLAFPVAGRRDWLALRREIAALGGVRFEAREIGPGRLVGDVVGPGGDAGVLARLRDAGLMPDAVAERRSASAVPTTVAAFAHLASLRGEGDAEVEWRRLVARIGDLATGHRPRFVPIDLGGDQGTWWRIQVGPFETPAAADGWCAEVMRRGQFCRVLPP
jgi:hypothetical protein